MTAPTCWAVTHVKQYPFLVCFFARRFRIGDKVISCDKESCFSVVLYFDNQGAAIILKSEVGVFERRKYPLPASDHADARGRLAFVSCTDRCVTQRSTPRFLTLNFGIEANCRSDNRGNSERLHIVAHCACESHFPFGTVH